MCPLGKKQQQNMPTMQLTPQAAGKQTERLNMSLKLVPFIQKADISRRAVGPSSVPRRDVLCDYACSVAPTNARIRTFQSGQDTDQSVSHPCLAKFSLGLSGQNVWTSLNLNRALQNSSDVLQKFHPRRSLRDSAVSKTRCLPATHSLRPTLLSNKPDKAPVAPQLVLAALFPPLTLFR